MSDDHHDVIIENEGSGVGALLGIILAIVVVMAIVWFFFLSGQAPADVQQPPINIDIQPPAS